MTPELQAKLQGLEERLAADPESEELREEILFEYLGPGLAEEPRRLHHILEYVRRFPRGNRACRAIGGCSNSKERASSGSAENYGKFQR